MFTGLHRNKETVEETWKSQITFRNMKTIKQTWKSQTTFRNTKTFEETQKSLITNISGAIFPSLLRAFGKLAWAQIAFLHGFAKRRKQWLTSTKVLLFHYYSESIIWFLWHLIDWWSYEQPAHSNFIWPKWFMALWWEKFGQLYFDWHQHSLLIATVKSKTSPINGVCPTSLTFQHSFHSHNQTCVYAV